MMESISGDEFESDGQESTAQEEKIFVAVRLRPLNGKEIAKGDASDWECVNTTTIIFKNNPSERSMYPNAYTFDRVYGCDSSTKQVYVEGVKGIALSVLNGINSSIFAYGQTSSGKTYTMSGVTEYAITDIYDYISRQTDREFALKFSAIEIYNECVRDLLSQDGAQLRLLDDPENFVDLAGSERASQTLAAGGNSHIPYRNSKLTRILQNSLGGNARTAIVCTMSPAHSHVEQSRNTLLFASCAKDVSTNAQVNVVVSDRALVKQLQQELAKLANELKTSPVSNDSASLIREMELQIKKMGKEIEKLTQQRDIAEARLDHLIRVTGTDPNSLPWEETGDLYKKSSNDEYPASDTYKDQGIEITSSIDNNNIIEISEDSITEEDQSVEETSSMGNNSTINRKNSKEDQNIEKRQCINNGITTEETQMDDSYKSSKENTHDIQTRVEQSPCSSDSEISDSEGICLTRSKSCNELPSTEKEIIAESTNNNGSETGKQDSHIHILPKSKSEADVTTINQQDSSTPVKNLDEKEIEQKIKSSEERDASTGTVKKTEQKANEFTEPENDWSMVFEKQRREIIKLWNECNTPLVHRTYFFLLFKGDQSDSVYMEVELRRLSFLKNMPSRATRHNISIFQLV
ncbi:hypothetical protein L1987_51644 [Smallanthus sonchifolius]|uniref:Uncharacterized protein n=1 Tax=Smallanthus sonchifolius TaxID=185202 RepID=A0ACB9ES12_9ASTR|nr:hypothetical protein L1987_51644 [Smallanthus sonchifolius]